MLAALYSYYLGSATVLSAVGAHEADPQQFQQLYNTHPPIEERIAALEKIASVQQT
ncbi:MAG TPA: hypothetical protein VNO87_09865 [Methylomirabilota bacterium]|nr:hypothetical protein [Methylomirabilota bacterium]